MDYGKYCLMVFLLTVLAVGGCTARKKGPLPEVEVSNANEASIQAVEAYDANNPQKSLALYKKLLEEDPSNPVYLNNMGVLYLEGGQPDAAADAFERASILDPNNTDYLVNSGFAKIQLDELDDAEAFFERALQLAPRTARAFYGKGVIYLKMNEAEIALGLFREALELDPMSEDSLFMMGFAEQKNELWMDAIKDYTAYIGLSHDAMQKANALSNRGLCYFRLSRYAEGMDDLDEAIALNPKNAMFYYNRAQGYQAQQQFEEAIQDYTRAISRRASFPEAYINRAEMNYLLGQKQKACADLKRACDLGICGPLESYQVTGKCED